MCRPVPEWHNLLPDHILCICEGQHCKEKSQCSCKEDKLALTFLFSLGIDIPQALVARLGNVELAK